MPQALNHLRLDKIAAVRKAAAAAWPEVLLMLELFGLDAAAAAPPSKTQTAMEQEYHNHSGALNGAAKGIVVVATSQRSSRNGSRGNAIKQQTTYTR